MQAATPSYQQSLRNINESNVKSRIEIRIECHNLPNLDTFSKSDPLVVCFLENRAANGAKSWVEIGRTEMIKDNLNPKFNTSIRMTYYFEVQQKLRFVVVDIDGPMNTGSLADHDFIGYLDVNLGNLVSRCKLSPYSSRIIFTPPRDMGYTFKQRSFNSQRESTITLHVEELAEGLRHAAQMRFSALSLDSKMMGLSKPNPYLVINKAVPGGSWVKVHQSEILSSTTSPAWKPMEIVLETLNAGDHERALSIAVWNRKSVAQDKLLGETQTCLREMLSGVKSFPLINKKKAQKRNDYQNSGILLLEEMNLVPRYTFLDYVASGTELGLVVAIDFTLSNRDPRDPTSLHFMGYNSRMNPYQEAIFAVGSILEPYDHDKQFPVYGFGAKLPSGIVSHCWPLSGDDSRVEVDGVDGVMAVYTNALQFVQLCGPTNFQPVISKVAREAKIIYERDKSNGCCSKYLILLIITDGIITDIDLTIREIVYASTLPLSIVIIGVGDADFSAMEVLDADDRPLHADGYVMQRDIVQFVPFNKFKNNPHLLTEATLAEIPTQLMTYCKMNRLRPVGMGE